MSLVIGFLTAGLQADELVLVSGQTLSGTILKTDGKTITLQMNAGGGQAEIPYPVAGIKTLHFINDPETLKLLNSADTEDLSKLQVLWEKRFNYMKLPESDTGAIGLSYARLLLAKKTKKAAGEAVTVAQQVEQEDWMASRKSEATRVRLSAMAASGKVEQAMAEAENMQDIAGSDESALTSVQVQAQLVKADLAFDKWQELEKDWPKWKLMPDKRKERSDLMNRALDGFLFPVVFYPGQSKLCAEGLYRACEIELKLGDTAAALIYAKEIINHYPETEYKAKAEKIVKENSKEDPDKKST